MQANRLENNTIFCQRDYEKPWMLVFTTFLVTCIMIAVTMITWRFSRKIQLFPIKGRGPRLAMIQMIYFLLLNLIPVIIEVLSTAGITWDDDRKVHLSQDFLKGLYFTIRTGCYMIYALRTVLIYANWKIPMENLLRPLWQIFGNEMKIIVMFFGLQLLLLIWACYFSDYFYTGYPSLDTFKESNQIGYVLVNLTWIEVIENLTLMTCFYMLRYALF